MTHIIKFYPVENADCTLIKLDNGKTVIVDCQICDAYDGDGNQTCYDVKEDLLKELAKDKDGHPFVDLFVNTHPHNDHCVGFADNFFHGAPEDYDDEDNKTIIAGEMWVTHRCMGNILPDSAVAIRQEAKRRRKLYDDDTNYTGGYGNYLRIVGYDEDKEYDSRYGYVPGTLVKKVNGKLLNLLEIFIHAPFKDDIENCKNEDDKNATSIVMQFGFKYENGGDIKRKVLIGGDAEHNIWQHILDRNKAEGRLDWDIFLAPHHCSWTFFNDSNNKEKVLQSAEDVLNHQIGNDAYIVSSSKVIKDEKPNPPCFEARKEYKKRLKTTSNFLNTATYNKENNIPQPIEFNIKKTVITIREDASKATEAQNFSVLLSTGGLRTAKTGLLSSATGIAAAASNGFYGEE